MKKYKILLCDADGTVLDFATAEDKALVQACRTMGIAIDAEKAARYKEINDALWRAFERKEVTQEALKTLRFERFFAEIGAQADADETARQYVQALGQQADEIEGAQAFLEEAAKRVPVVIVTNGIASVQRSRFALSRLGVYLSGHVISGELGFAKPDPRMIFHALAPFGIAKEEALMLGDEPRSDIAAAVAAGTDSCWYNPHGRVNETPHHPTYEVRALDEVLKWL